MTFLDDLRMLFAAEHEIGSQATVAFFVMNVPVT